MTSSSEQTARSATPLATLNVTTAGAYERLRLLQTAKTIAGNLGIAEDGYRVIMNCNRSAGQTVFHIHAHLLGGRQLLWPPG